MQIWHRFSFEARRVVVMAEEEARRLRHPEVGPEHILLAVLGLPPGLTHELISSLGVKPDMARAAIAQRFPPGVAPPNGQIPFGRLGRKAVENSLREALVQGERWVHAEYLFIGVLRVRESPAVTVMSRIGIEHRPAQDALRALRRVLIPVTLLLATDDGVRVVELQADGSATAVRSLLPGEPIGWIAAAPLSEVPTVLAGSRRAGGLYRSDDGGRSFHRFALEGESVFVVERGLVDKETMLIGTAAGLSLTRDGGKTFTRLLGSGPVRDIVVHPSDAGRIVVGIDDGVMVSNDSGATWERSLSAGSVRSVVDDPQEPRRLLAGTVEGIFVSQNAGATWDPVHRLDRPVAAIAFDRSLPSFVRACVQAASRTLVFRSEDGGRTWPRRPAGTIDLASPQVLIQHPIDVRAFFVAGNDADRTRLFATRDGGKRWHEIAVPSVSGIWDVAAISR